MDEIVFTPAKLEDLKKKYKSAVEIGAPAFTFEGKALLVDYAKYLIQYLEDRFNTGS